MKRKAGIKIVMGLLAALFGAASFFAAEWPIRRRIEVKPGTFVEAATFSDGFLVCLILGVGLLISSGYLLWLAARLRWDAV